jgi:hypothetical protein
MPKAGFFYATLKRGIALVGTLVIVSWGLEASFRDQFEEPGKGARLRIFDQDPSLDKENGGISTVFIPRKISAGPSDLFIQVVQTSVRPNSNGDFTDYTPKTPEFDSVHTFAVASSVYQMYIQDLWVLSTLFPKSLALKQATKIFDKRKFQILKITPHAGEDQNAYYSREEDGSRVLMFFSFTSEIDKKTKIHTCQSSEVVAHEAGHSFLDLLHPEYFVSQSPQTGGLHEAFGDLTSLFWTLSQPRQCGNVIIDTRGNLHRQNFLAVLAEQFGKEIGLKEGLRNADDDVSLLKVEQEVHEISRVFTGALYDILADAFKVAYQAKKDQQDMTHILADTGVYLRRLFLHSIVESGNFDPTFSNVAFQMLTLAKARANAPKDPLDDLGWPGFIKNQFTRRDVPVALNSRALSFLDHMKVKKAGICGTIHRKFT